MNIFKKVILTVSIGLLSLVGYSQQETINVGTSPNSGTGDPLRTAFQKTNTNFTYLFTKIDTIDNRLDAIDDSISALRNDIVIGGSGTVTTISVVNTNGLSGTVANPTTTPTITLIPDTISKFKTQTQARADTVKLHNQIVNKVDLTTNQSVAGEKTFSDTSKFSKTILVGKKMAIGSDSANAELTIYKNLYASARIYSGDNGTSSFDFFEGTPTLNPIRDGFKVKYDGTNNTLKIHAVETLTEYETRGLSILRGSGFIGIGTTNPQSRLHIASGVNSTTQFQMTGASTNLYLTPESDRFRFSNIASGKSIAFETGGSEVFRINSNGRLGIKTASPDSVLGVVGGGKFSGGLKVDGTIQGGTVLINSGTMSDSSAITWKTARTIAQTYGGSSGDSYFRLYNSTTITPGDTSIRAKSFRTEGVQHYSLIDSMQTLTTVVKADTIYADKSLMIGDETDYIFANTENVMLDIATTKDTLIKSDSITILNSGNINTSGNISSVSIKCTQPSCSLTDNAPTQGELVTCLGSASTAGAGTMRTIVDSTSGEMYLISSNGTNWGFIELTIP